ncbi:MULTISPECIES: isochorismatase family cysteine hydrolase [unclassified Caulobacter]|uniref:isochorismatase family cysteine hydrolase n=1 Tax=unclassified Caulobacter TaxID=2648921 RepID=UPI000F63896C|nr:MULTISPECIES: isochorismatase family cysteine hydrolase [unclassified Caulobacter]RRN63994.1 cysteine hydrolase [Caulobacter sp. 602-1]HJV41673.1 isochorismatase family cysteine hydrolase [Caulobacter sp.]
MTYDPKTTAVLLVDPYNDFLSEGGKTWPRLRAIAEEVSLLDHLRTVVAEARAAGLQIVFVPHHRWEPGDYEDWRHATPYQRAGAQRQIFARGSWGGAFHDDFQPREGDIVAKEHWGSSGFANTDLDLRLRQAGIQSLILVGLIANTCIEATGRFAMELGYDVTLVRDATAAFSAEAMHAAHEINGPTYTREILTTAVLVGRLREIPR